MASWEAAIATILKEPPVVARPATKYGPGNPHPLSVVKTELVWDGKSDEFGNRREVDAAGLAMPLPRIETVDEPRARVVDPRGAAEFVAATPAGFARLVTIPDACHQVFNDLSRAETVRELAGWLDGALKR